MREQDVHVERAVHASRHAVSTDHVVIDHACRNPRTLGRAAPNRAGGSIMLIVFDEIVAVIAFS